jgi:Glycosyltransferase family 20
LRSRCGRPNGGVWLGWSGKVAAADRLETRSVKQKNVEYAVTDLSNDDYQEYYNGFANRVLWPILHYRLDLAEFARRDLSGYFRVNDHFATELEKIIKDDDLIWVHDYHLIPIADALRRRGHANRIGFFLHVPMPPPEVLTSLPPAPPSKANVRCSSIPTMPNRWPAPLRKRWLCPSRNVGSAMRRCCAPIWSIMSIRFPARIAPPDGVAGSGLAASRGNDAAADASIAGAAS